MIAHDLQPQHLEQSGAMPCSSSSKYNTPIRLWLDFDMSVFFFAGFGINWLNRHNNARWCNIINADFSTHICFEYVGLWKTYLPMMLNHLLLHRLQQVLQNNHPSEVVSKGVPTKSFPSIITFAFGELKFEFFLLALNVIYRNIVPSKYTK